MLDRLKTTRGTTPGVPTVAETFTTQVSGIEPGATSATLPAVPTLAETITLKASGIKLRLIPAGEFLMGSDSTDPDAVENEFVVIEGTKRKHRVKITRPFYMGVTEVTQGQYKAVVGKDPSRFKQSDRPAEQVSWLDAVLFCNELSEMEGRTKFYAISGETVIVRDWSAGGFRLPTEAEWEYACRGKNDVRYSFGNDASELGKYAWFVGNSEGSTHPVSAREPNGFGLFDVHGNVWEWCWDVYAKDYYASLPNPAIDPRGPEKVRAATRVLRGGSWLFVARSARSAYRLWVDPGNRAYDIGFRLAANSVKK